ncbi:hypothetical protein [Actinokineospora sp.]|uniref:hypothetical protein n=1 Tax=Actinokineospora sp. TaxID=1872133 RepID=UPI00403778EC
MTTALVLTALLALLVYGLDRNNLPQPQPRPRLAGSTDVEDRDTARVVADLRATRAVTRHRRPATTARREARVRLAIGSR